MNRTLVQRVRDAMAFARATLVHIGIHIHNVWKAFVEFSRPLPATMFNKVNPDEMARVIITGAAGATVTAGATATSVATRPGIARAFHGIVQHPDFMMVVVVPLFSGFILGVLDYARRKKHGDPDGTQSPPGMAGGGAWGPPVHPVADPAGGANVGGPCGPGLPAVEVEPAGAAPAAQGPPA